MTDDTTVPEADPNAARRALNEPVIAEFRNNDGRVGGQFEGTPLLLLTHTGARSGRRRTSPMSYAVAGGRLLVFAANGGRPSHPGWYHNVRVHPDVRVEVGTDAYDARATELTGAERERAMSDFGAGKDWATAIIARATEAGRTIPVIALDRA